MSHQLVSRISRLSSSSHGLCFSELRRLSTAATPYLLSKETICEKAKTPFDGPQVVDMNLYDPRTKERVKIPEMTLPKELKGSMKIGSSRGWVGMKELDGSKMHLTNMFNPCASLSSHEVITLPPLDDSETLISSISLSASPNQQKERDCVVAARSSLGFLILCRPGDSAWTRVEAPFCTPYLMYSERDGKFYLYIYRKKNCGGGPLEDLVKSSSGFPAVSPYRSFPANSDDIPKSRQDEVISTLKTQYLVESPSGDHFIVHWYYELRTREILEAIRNKTPSVISSYTKKSKSFMVFRQDTERKTSSYTEDIGDLCIFVGKSEAFCVSATEYPGLEANSVYYADFSTRFGFYDLSSNTLHDLTDEAVASSSYMWLAPLQ